MLAVLPTVELVVVVAVAVVDLVVVGVVLVVMGEGVVLFVVVFWVGSVAFVVVGVAGEGPGGPESEKSQHYQTAVVHIFYNGHDSNFHLFHVTHKCYF